MQIEIEKKKDIKYYNYYLNARIAKQITN